VVVEATPAFAIYWLTVDFLKISRPIDIGAYYGFNAREIKSKIKDIIVEAMQNEGLLELSQSGVST
jgi:hypothetical protein